MEADHAAVPRTFTHLSMTNAVHALLFRPTDGVLGGFSTSLTSDIEGDVPFSLRLQPSTHPFYGRLRREFQNRTSIQLRKI